MFSGNPQRCLTPFITSLQSLSFFHHYASRSYSLQRAKHSLTTIPTWGHRAILKPTHTQLPLFGSTLFTIFIFNLQSNDLHSPPFFFFFTGRWLPHVTLATWAQLGRRTCSPAPSIQPVESETQLAQRAARDKVTFNSSALHLYVLLSPITLLVLILLKPPNQQYLKSNLFDFIRLHWDSFSI